MLVINYRECCDVKKRQALKLNQTIVRKPSLWPLEIGGRIFAKPLSKWVNHIIALCLYHDCCIRHLQSFQLNLLLKNLGVCALVTHLLHLDETGLLSQTLRKIILSRRNFKLVIKGFGHCAPCWHKFLPKDHLAQ